MHQEENTNFKESLQTMHDRIWKKPDLPQLWATKKAELGCIAENLFISEKECQIVLVLMGKRKEYPGIEDLLRMTTYRKPETLRKDIETLIKLHLVRVVKCRGKIHYALVQEADEKLRNCQIPTDDHLKNLSSLDMIKKISSLYIELMDYMIPTNTGIREIRELFEYNPQCEFVKRVKSYGIMELSDEDFLMGLFACVEYIRGRKHIRIMDYSRMVDPDVKDPYVVFSDLMDGTSPLLISGMLENDQCYGIHLTDKAVQELLLDFLPEDMMPRHLPDTQAYISNADIPDNSFCYGPKTQSMIEAAKKQMNSFLAKENKTWADKFGCIFYGNAGDGMLNCALTLIKKSGYDVRYVYLGNLMKNIQDGKNIADQIRRDSDVYKRVFIIDGLEYLFEQNTDSEEDRLKRKRLMELTGLMLRFSNEAKIGICHGCWDEFLEIDQEFDSEVYFYE